MDKAEATKGVGSIAASSNRNRGFVVARHGGVNRRCTSLPPPAQPGGSGASVEAVQVDEFNVRPAAGDIDEPRVEHRREQEQLRVEGPDAEGVPGEFEMPEVPDADGL